MKDNRFQSIRSVVVFVFVLILALVACAAPVTPQTMDLETSATPTTVPGCEEKPIDIEKYGGKDFQNPEVISSSGGQLHVTLTVDYAYNEIAGCKVHLRSYNGKLVGPTLRAKPGDTLFITLQNNLPPNPSSDHDTNTDETHGFNTTNLHTHGLHVSPEGNSDNVLLKIEPMGGPQSDPNPFNYTIEIPPTHQPGTFWYHAHVHGSTAVQVSSGMEGALIIEGGLDDVPTIAAAAEKILVFQQISYDTQGEIEQLESSFGPGTWATLNREHTINGQLFPTISMQPGEVQRWRMIHGGVRETIMVKLVGPSSSDQLPDPETLNELPSYDLNEVAVDGIALGKLVPWQQVELNPGYRSDVLVTAPLTSGNYFLIDAATTAEQSLNGVAEPTNFLAHIVIGVDPNPMKLPDAEELVKLKPFADIQDSEIKATQEVKFCVCQTTDGGVEFTVNGKVFSLDNKWDLQLGQAAEWNVSTEEASLAPSHPFHIHVNPFQVERTLPDGTTEMVWRDTLLVIKGQPQRLLTRYQDYPGKFVLHCHILDHEDQGMMQLLEVVR